MLYCPIAYLNYINYINMYLRTCSISYMHCTMVYGMLIKLQLQLQLQRFRTNSNMILGLTEAC